MASEREIEAVARGLEDLYGDAMAATPVSESWRQDAKEILEAAERARASEDKVETARAAYARQCGQWPSVGAMRAALEAIGVKV